MIGVTLLHRQGYFHQHLDCTGNQLESPAAWNFEAPGFWYPSRANRSMFARGDTWSAAYLAIPSRSTFLTPVSAITVRERSSLTDALYGGNSYHRLCQEVVLGIG